MKKFTAVLFNFKTLLIIYIIASIATSVQSYLLPPKTFQDEGKLYTHYNNYIVFKQSHFHLIHGQDPYRLYPDEQWDLYKYSPAFSVFFGVFAYLPDIVGLNLWNFLNSLVLLFSIYLLPGISNRIKGLILFTILIELITSQSNALVAGLIIFSFGLLEKENYALGTLSIALSVFVKLFGIVALVMLIFYPKKWKFFIYLLLWFVILFLLPLIVVDREQFKPLYMKWLNLLSSDHAASYGLSVMGWLKTWFDLGISKFITMMIGAVILCLPLIRTKLYKDYSYRLLLLASVLIWVIIFNHKSESPTFIIAMCGVSIWFFTQQQTKFNLVLFILAFVFASLSPTDIFPAFLRKNWVIPYVLKAVPVFLIWIKIIYEMGFGKYDPVLQVTNRN
jgi:hypothetical protein